MQELSPAIFNIFGDHLFEIDALENHSFKLTKLILKEYFKIRIFHEPNKQLDAIRCNRTRSVNTKTIHFRGE